MTFDWSWASVCLGDPWSWKSHVIFFHMPLELNFADVRGTRWILCLGSGNRSGNLDAIAACLRFPASNPTTSPSCYALLLFPPNPHPFLQNMFSPLALPLKFFSDLFLLLCSFPSLSPSTKTAGICPGWSLMVKALLPPGMEALLVGIRRCELAGKF